MRASHNQIDFGVRNRAFSLIEALTVIFILGLLIALIIPAVQAARESSRRAQCASNLRQIGLAINSYASLFGSFPAAFNGLGYSVHTVLLPYLDQRPLYDSLNMGVFSQESMEGTANFSASLTRIAVFVCPTDDYPTTAANGWSSYPANRGVWRRSGRPNNGAFVPPSSGCPSLASFTDGMSTTGAMSESVFGPVSLTTIDPKGSVFSTPLHVSADQFDQFASECHAFNVGTAKDPYQLKGIYWHVSGYTHTNYNHLLGPNDHSCNPGGWTEYGAFPASSRHLNVVNLLYADGHVLFSSETISVDVWRAIGTRNGGEIATNQGF